MTRVLPLLLSMLFCVTAFAQTNIFNNINDYTAVTDIDACDARVTVADDLNISAGDRVLLIQMQGAQVSTANDLSFGIVQDFNGAGNYEFATVKNVVNDTIIYLEKSILRNYDVTGKVQLVTVPVYQNGANVTGTLKCQRWDGTIGGALVFESLAPVTMSGDIDVSERGFLGGHRFQSNYNCLWVSTHSNQYYTVSDDRAARKGEGIANFDPLYECGRGPWANGGGGGNDHNTGGAGGANYGLGGQGGKKINPSPFYCNGEYRGRSGINLPYGNNVAKVFMGGGGGAGHQNNNRGSHGGDGGAIIIIKAPSLDGSGNFIRANGQVADTSGGDGAGGGGAGGTILLDIPTISNVNIEAIGGNGGHTFNGNSADLCHGTGGGGGGGVLWLSRNSVPASVTVDLGGGKPGLNINIQSPCLGDSSDARSGVNGSIITGLNLVESQLEVGGFADAGSDQTICDGDTAILGASGGVSYNWDSSPYLSCTNCPNPLAVPLSTTDFIVEVIDTAGCTASDTVRVDVQDVLITSFPYFESFENSCNGWSAGGTNSSWALGQPGGSEINTAADGNKAWVTELSGSYTSNENSWLVSPRFDLSGMTSPYIKFKAQLDAKNGDGVVVQYSIDGGNNWVNAADATDWTQTNVASTPGGSNYGWTGNSAGWRTLARYLFKAAGESDVRVRFAFAGTGSPGANEGLAIDSFSLVEILHDVDLLSVAPIACDTAVQSLILTITNHGALTQNSVLAGYKWRKETNWQTSNLPNPLAHGDTVSFTVDGSFYARYGHTLVVRLEDDEVNRNNRKLIDPGCDCEVTDSIWASNVQPFAFTMNWNYVPGAEGYRLFAKENGKDILKTYLVTNPLQTSKNAPDFDFPVLLEPNTTYKFWMSAVCDTNITGAYTDSINVTTLSSVRLAGSLDASTNLDVSIYPNPAKDRMVIQLQNPADFDINFSISDLSGRVHFSSMIPAGQNQLKVDVSALPSGLYLVHGAGGDWIGQVKVVVE